MQVIKNMPKWLWAVIVGTLIALIAACGIVFASVYRMHQEFVLPEVSPAGLSANLSGVKNDGEKVMLNLSEQQFDALCLAEVKAAQSNGGNSPQITALHFNTAEKKLYLKTKSSHSYQNCFILDADPVAENGQIVFEINSCQIGGGGLWIPRWVLKHLTGIGNRLALIPEKNTDVLHLNSVQSSKGMVALSYRLDAQVMQSWLKQCADDIDDARVALHGSRADLPESFLSFGKNRQADTKLAADLAQKFFQDENALKQFSFLLKTDKLDDFYDRWAGVFFRSLSKEELKNSSEEDLMAGITTYHDKFFGYLLHYLYQNPGYTITDDGISINGVPIHAKDVFLANGDKAYLYNISFSKDGETVFANYSVNGQKIKKAVYVRR
jgi:hypothetical protein